MKLRLVIFLFPTAILLAGCAYQEGLIAQQETAAATASQKNSEGGIAVGIPKPAPSAPNVPNPAVGASKVLSPVTH